MFVQMFRKEWLIEIAQKANVIPCSAAGQRCVCVKGCQLSMWRFDYDGLSLGMVVGECVCRHDGQLLSTDQR